MLRAVSSRSASPEVCTITVKRGPPPSSRSPNCLDAAIDYLRRQFRGQDNIRPPAGHVGGYGHRPWAAGSPDNVLLPFALQRIEHLVRYILCCQPPADNLRLFNRPDPHQRRLTNLPAAGHFGYYRIQKGVVAFVNAAGQIHPLYRMDGKSARRRSSNQSGVQIPGRPSMPSPLFRIAGYTWPQSPGPKSGPGFPGRVGLTPIPWPPAPIADRAGKCSRVEFSPCNGPAGVPNPRPQRSPGPFPAESAPAGFGTLDWPAPNGAGCFSTGIRSHCFESRSLRHCRRSPRTAPPGNPAPSASGSRTAFPGQQRSTGP